MKKIILLLSKYVFALCACFALAVPLHAFEQSAKATGMATSATVVTKSSLTTNHVQKPVSKTKQKAAQVDFKLLKERLKNTDAIGFFTKLAIRNDIVDLMDKIKKYRKKSLLKIKMKEIRSSFDGLLLKIIALLRDDPILSRDLYVGRESIWESLLEVKA